MKVLIIFLFVCLPQFLFGQLNLLNEEVFEDKVKYNFYSEDFIPDLRIEDSTRYEQVIKSRDYLIDIENYIVEESTDYKVFIDLNFDRHYYSDRVYLKRLVKYISDIFNKKNNFPNTSLDFYFYSDSINHLIDVEDIRFSKEKFDLEKGIFGANKNDIRSIINKDKKTKLIFVSELNYDSFLPAENFKDILDSYTNLKVDLLTSKGKNNELSELITNYNGKTTYFNQTEIFRDSLAFLGSLKFLPELSITVPKSCFPEKSFYLVNLKTSDNKTYQSINLLNFLNPPLFNTATRFSDYANFNQNDTIVSFVIDKNVTLEGFQYNADVIDYLEFDNITFPFYSKNDTILIIKPHFKEDIKVKFSEITAISDACFNSNLVFINNKPSKFIDISNQYETVSKRKILRENINLEEYKELDLKAFYGYTKESELQVIDNKIKFEDNLIGKSHGISLHNFHKAKINKNEITGIDTLVYLFELDNILFVKGSTLFIIDPANNKELFSYPFLGKLLNVYFIDGKIYINYNDRFTFATIDLESQEVKPVIFDSDNILLGENDDYLLKITDDIPISLLDSYTKDTKVSQYFKQSFFNDNFYYQEAYFSSDGHFLIIKNNKMTIIIDLVNNRTISNNDIAYSVLTNHNAEYKPVSIFKYHYLENVDHRVLEHKVDTASVLDYNKELMARYTSVNNRLNFYHKKFDDYIYFYQLPESDKYNRVQMSEDENSVFLHYIKDDVFRYVHFDITEVKYFYDESVYLEREILNEKQNFYLGNILKNYEASFKNIEVPIINTSESNIEITSINTNTNFLNITDVPFSTTFNSGDTIYVKVDLIYSSYKIPKYYIDVNSKKGTIRVEVVVGEYKNRIFPIQDEIDLLTLEKGSIYELESRFFYSFKDVVNANSILKAKYDQIYFDESRINFDLLDSIRTLNIKANLLGDHNQSISFNNYQYFNHLINFKFKVVENLEEEYQSILYIHSTTGKVGEKVELPIKLLETGLKSINGSDFSLNILYDNKYLEPEFDYTLISESSDMNEVKIESEINTSNDEIFTLSFRIKQPISNPFHKVKMSNFEVDGIKQTVSYIDGIVLDESNPISSINDFSNDFDWSIFPNPAQDYTNINFNRHKPNKIEIFDISGKKILELNSEELKNKNVINTQNFLNGVYTVIFTYENKFYYQKLNVIN